jgi:hypothetical protein
MLCDFKSLTLLRTHPHGGAEIPYPHYLNHNQY